MEGVYCRPIAFGRVELRGSNCYIDGVPTKSPEKIAAAILDYTSRQPKIADIDTSKEILKEYCSKKAYSKPFTKQRVAILNAIHEIDTIFCVEDLYLLLQDTETKASQPTIYKNIKLFLKAGIIRMYQQPKDYNVFSSIHFELI